MLDGTVEIILRGDAVSLSWVPEQSCTVTVLSARHPHANDRNAIIAMKPVILKLFIFSPMVLILNQTTLWLCGAGVKIAEYIPVI